MTAKEVINCMHPDDWKQVDDLVSRHLIRALTTRFNTGWGKRTAVSIWIANDVGKKGWSEDGREVCISVIRDISEEVESRIRLERQAGEQEQLARGTGTADRYNHLLQSVLCGIVQYHSTSQGGIQNANREAIISLVIPRRVLGQEVLAGDG